MVTTSAQIAHVPVTGERVLPYLHDQEHPLVQMAWFAYTVAVYQWIAKRCNDLHVVDAGVGVGYGTALLQPVARRIYGVDIARDAVAFAVQHYPALAGRLALGDALALPIASQHVDLVCAVEVIEHVQVAATVLAEFARVLRPNGCCLLSTPNRLVFSPGRAQPWHPFHTREYSAHELAALLLNHFESVELHSIVFTHRAFKARYLRAALEHPRSFPLDHLERFVYWHIPPWNRLPLGVQHVQIVPQVLPHCAGLLAVCRDPII